MEKRPAHKGTKKKTQECYNYGIKEYLAREYLARDYRKPKTKLEPQNK